MKRKVSSIRLPKTGAIYGIIILIIVFSIILDGKYITVSNVINIFRQSATLCIMTICAFLAILTHQTDLSIGATASLSGIVAAMILQKGGSVIFAVICAILAGLFIGAINGLFAGFTTIPTFIVTLATMSIAESIGMILNNGTISVKNPVFKFVNGTNLWIIPFPTIIVMVLYFFFFWVLKYRRYGTYLYAVGGKEEAALTAGINVRWHKMSVYLINGALAAFAGLLYTARLNAANPSQGIGLELDGICAAVLGGAALTGGEGNIWGALLGAIAISILRNGMNRIGLRIITQMTIFGLMLIIILALDVFNRKRGAKTDEK